MRREITVGDAGIVSLSVLRDAETEEFSGDPHDVFHRFDRDGDIRLTLSPRGSISIDVVLDVGDAKVLALVLAEAIEKAEA